MSTPTIQQYQAVYGDGGTGGGAPHPSEFMLIVVKTLLSIANYFIQQALGSIPGVHRSTADTNAKIIAPTARKLTSLSGSNNTADEVFLWVYDQKTVPDQNSVPIHEFIIPGNTSGAGSNIPLPSGGIVIHDGLAIRITANQAAGDNTAIGANTVLVNYAYKE